MEMNGSNQNDTEKCAKLQLKNIVTKDTKATQKHTKNDAKTETKVESR